ncbi:MAG: FAD:protein FMN transferase [Termitinemataceae bacterium]|nr:MAG: FAD:protein FMN transferase [Termitinemataceae bacterium]
MRDLLHLLVFRVAIICMLVCASCTKLPPAEVEFVMGTVCRVNFFEEGSKEVYQKIFKRLREIDHIFSANDEKSIMADVNKNAGIKAVEVPQEFIYVLQAALEIAELSGGAFDPTVGPLVKLWNITSFENNNDIEHKVPSDSEIDEALKLIDYHDVEVDIQAQTVFLTHEGMRLDLGGIVKGYAADEIVRIAAQENGIKSAVIDLGGNIYVYGEKLRRGKNSGSKNAGEKWKVGVQDPAKSRGHYLGYVETAGGTLVSSGIYERFFELDGKRYHHILSTVDGRPIDNGIASCTIINEGDTSLSMTADALSTTVFALGFEDGTKLLQTMTDKYKYKLSAIFIMIDGSTKFFGNAELKGTS